MDDLYCAESDWCNEDFALSQSWKIHRSSDVQQIVWRFENFDEKVSDRSRNLHCLECFDACKTKCNCAGPLSATDRMEYFLKWLIYPIFDIKSIEDRTGRGPAENAHRHLHVGRTAEGHVSLCALQWCIPTKSPPWIVNERDCGESPKGGWAMRCGCSDESYR